MKGYSQLTQGLRHQIGILKKAGENQKDIAGLAKVSPSTICRELQRNTGKRGYRPKQAQRKAETRRERAAKPLKMALAAIGLVGAKPSVNWGPGQVSGWLKQEPGMAISHGRIYQRIWAGKLKGGALYKAPRHSGKKREQYGPKDKRGQARNRASIDGRPTIVSEKARLGDWGVDTAIGKNHQGALVTIVDRASKFTLTKKASGKHADVVAEAAITLPGPYLDKALAITADNGKEFAGHEKIKAAPDADVYFARPYSPWERGLNENTNGLIRQYLTKGGSFENMADKDLDGVMAKLNRRPRKPWITKRPMRSFLPIPR